MTIIDSATEQRLQPVVFDLYRDIHKGIRSELFSLVTEAGRVDPSNDCDLDALAGQIRQAVEFLGQHAEHEDHALQPVLEQHLPTLFAKIASDHEALEARMDLLVALAGDLRGSARRAAVHELYIELSSFTGAYLLHQDVEERQVGPGLELAIGPEAVLGLHMSILANIPAQDMITALAVMFPAMNVDDRSELLGGMQATAPAEAFYGVWSLVKSVLSTDDSRAVAQRLGLN